MAARIHRLKTKRSKGHKHLKATTTFRGKGPWTKRPLVIL